jgi:MFS family permease
LFPKEKKPSLRLTITNVTLVANAFVWYLLVFDMLRRLVDQNHSANPELFAITVFGINAGSMAISAFLGSFVTEKTQKREGFLTVWMLSGVLISLIPTLFNMADAASIIVVSCLFGSYFGLGMPAVMGYFAASTSIGNRAKTSGVAFLLMGLLFSVINVLSIGNVFVACVVLSVLRLESVLVFYGIKGKENVPVQTEKSSYREILSNKSFILYFISWCMFSLVNYLSVPITTALFQSDSNYLFMVNVVEFVFVAIAAVIAGFIADSYGRKRLIMIGFILLGIAYGGLGLFPIQYSGYFYIVADGVAWGIFFSVLLFTIWGDLAQTKNSEKFYFLGALPFVLSSFLKLVFAFYVPGAADVSLFSFASFFLFIAVLPLLYAPETVSEKAMRDRELRSYLDQAYKTKGKYS